MLGIAFGSLVVALIAALFGFTGIAAAATQVALIIFYIFAAVFVIALVAALALKNKLTGK
jgi:uncharacterized membrane protein YtjA (UPF0391 family)